MEIVQFGFRQVLIQVQYINDYKYIIHIHIYNIYIYMVFSMCWLVVATVSDRIEVGVGGERLGDVWDTGSPSVLRVIHGNPKSDVVKCYKSIKQSTILAGSILMKR